MALCIIDEESKISVLAKLFFTELARKGNALYNVMPDIISRLSDPEAGIEETKFREILKYIIGLIEKDKHLESLVEKLCQRFRVTKTERQWRDLVSLPRNRGSLPFIGLQNRKTFTNITRMEILKVGIRGSSFLDDPL